MTSWHKCDNFSHDEETFGIRQTSFYFLNIYKTCDVAVEDGNSKQRSFFKILPSMEETEHLITQHVDTLMCRAVF